MITKITSENDLEFYAPRFQQITEALAIVEPNTRDAVAQAVAQKVNTIVGDARAQTYLNEVISGQKVRSMNKDVLMDGFASALIEHSEGSLRALYAEELAAGTMTSQDIDDMKLTQDVIDEVSNKIEDIADVAVAKAQEVGLVVDSLETYFSNLDQIKKLQTSQLEDGKFLLVMPADEPYFEIDANTRIINVPPVFKKNGVGVYGDHFAELLTFKIDRYFDNQDFMNTKIAINWNFTPNGSRVPAFEEPQAQMAFAKDDELEPGYVVFGFFITKEMTPSKGTLSFSVTCYNDADGEIIYSFNTQIAQLVINDGFTLLDPQKVDTQSSKDFLDRLSSSAYTPEGVSPIDDPVWELGALDEDGNPLGLEEVLNFHMDANGIEDEILDITTQAYTPGIVTMKYTWYATPIDGTVAMGRDPDTVTKPSDYFRTRDIEPQENSVYYVKKNGAIDPKPLPWEENAEENELTVEQAFADNMEIYELGSTYEATSAGTYQVEAQASKTTVRSNGTFIRTVSNSIQSNGCLVPAAAKPAVAIEVESALTPENDDFVLEGEDLGYKYIDNAHPPVINAVVTIDPDDQLSNPNGSLGAVAVEVLKSGEIEPLDAETIEINTENEKYEFSILPESGAKQVNAADVTEEGQYQVRAINRRNHTYGVSEPSSIVTTSFVAPKITKIDVYTMDGDTQIKVLENGDVPANATLNPLTPEDGVNVQLTPAHPSRLFVIDNMTEENLKYGKTDYFVEELVKSGTEFTLAINSPSGHNEGEEGTPDVIDVEYDRDFVDSFHYDASQGAYVFTIDRDDGYYRIRTENRYNGTLRTGYSAVFSVNKLGLS